MSIWYLRVTTVQIITALNPIIITYLSVIILKENFYIRYLIGIIICIIGSLLIILNEKKGSSEIKINNTNNPDNSKNIPASISGLVKGLLCAFTNTLITGLGDICNKVLAKNHIPNSSQIFYTGFFSIIYALVYVLFTQRFKVCLGYILLTGCQGTIFFAVSAFFNAGLSRIDLAKAAPISYTRVVFVLLLGGVLLGEKVYFTDFVGAALIISYMWYNLRNPIIKKK